MESGGRKGTEGRDGRSGEAYSCSQPSWSIPRNGIKTVTDEPFAETSEVLGGYYLIDVENLDEAIAIAAQHPGARMGTVEIRPLYQLDGLP